MARTLIPRSDSVSAKIIEPSDFENLFSADIVQDYIKSGFTLSAGTGLNCNVSSGVIRFKGLYLQSDATEAVTVSASTTNAIYVKLNRDGNGEAESWSFSISASGDTFQIGNAITSGSAVTSTNTSNNPATKPGLLSNTELGPGTSGDVLYSNGSSWTKLAKGADGQYLQLASGIPSWVTMHTHPTTAVTRQRDVSTSDASSATSNYDDTGLSVTLPTRSGGFFIATASCYTSGGPKLRFEHGSTNGDFITGQNGSVTTLSYSGALDGQVLKVTFASFGGSCIVRGGHTDDGSSHMDVLEVSVA